MDRRYEEYRDSNDMTDAEALRNLIRKGLDDEPEISKWDDWMLTTASNLAAIALLVGLLVFPGVVAPTAAAFVGGVTLAVAAALLVETHFRVVRQLGGDGAADADLEVSE